MSNKLVIIKLSIGNYNSISKCLKKLNINHIVSDKNEDITSANKLILPGIGSFGSFMKEIYEKKYSTGKLSVHPNTIDRIMMYSWPGNIRELQHATERAVLMCTENKIHEQDLIQNRIKSNEKDTEMDLDIVRMEKRFIEKALRLHNGNMTKASAELGITRTALYRRLEKYGL